ncbi:MAG: PilW family protein [Candidatus Zixiibacteriota bacterium]
MKKCLNKKGFTLLEVLIATLLGSVLTMGALHFYVTEHNNLITQYSISDMQQNLRSSLNEMTIQIRNAGANLPDNYQAIESATTNPDTLTVRYARIGGNISIGEKTSKLQTAPIHVAKGSDLSSFSIGDKVYLWYTAQNQGEWFTITNVQTNNGSGWEEISHSGQELLFDPQTGDAIIALQEVKYFINANDPSFPLFMRSLNGDTAQVYAENINDLQLKYYLSTFDTVDVVTPFDSIFVVNVSMTFQTIQEDYEMAKNSGQGYRFRTLETEVLVRNNRF